MAGTSPQLKSGLHSEILGKTAHMLLQDSDPDTLCRAIYNELREPFGVDVYFHFLASPDGTHLELASSGGADTIREMLGGKLDFGVAVCGNVAKRAANIYVTEVYARNDDMTSLIRGAGVRAYDCHPLVVRGKLLGTLSFGSTSRDSYADEERELFSLIAQQVTIATDRRLQAEHMRELERLAAVGRMSASLAHEINNPLESLSNILYLLHQELHSDEAAALVTQAESQVAQLADTSHRTLDLVRGRHQKPHPLDISQLAHELVADIRLPQHTRLRTEIQDHLCVSATPGELRQVLFNLLINAAHFSPVGKEVVLTVRALNGQAELRIEDQGPGISEETRAHLFEPFFTSRTSSGGTGVGLWISREIVTRFGGELTFDSDPTQRPGTTFTVTLPLID